MFLTALTLLLLVMDPVGNVPTTLAVLQNTAPERRRFVVLREMLIALVLLMGALFLGPAVMRLLGLEPLVLQLAGGIMLFIIAINMIFPGEHTLTHPEDTEPLIVPLAVPLVAGPSAMATVMLLSSQLPEHRMEIIGAILTAWAITALALVSATQLSNALGKKGLRAMERFMGILLVMVAVQMFVTGVRTFVVELRQQPQVTGEPKK